jgi:hypothetical protein
MKPFVLLIASIFILASACKKQEQDLSSSWREDDRVFKITATEALSLPTGSRLATSAGDLDFLTIRFFDPLPTQDGEYTYNIPSWPDTARTGDAWIEIEHIDITHSPAGHSYYSSNPIVPQQLTISIKNHVITVKIRNVDMDKAYYYSTKVFTLSADFTATLD